VATWADWWGAKLEMWDAVPQNIALVSQAGGRGVMHSDSSDGIQRLNQEAAKAMAAARAAGIAVSEEEALRWLTINPAWVMGVDDRTGSLEAGKMADVVLWDRNPFSVYARAQRVWADGVVTYDARTGAAVPSDFELSEPLRTAALQTPHPARPPALPNSDTALLPVENADCTVIRNATGVDGKPVSLTLRDGRIGGGGAGCRELEARGRVLAPGFIDPWSELGLVEVLLEETSNDTGQRRYGPRSEREPEAPIHASLRAADSINPYSALLPVARTGGITSAVASPTGGLVSGQAAWIGMDGAVLKAPLAIQVRLGLGGKEAAGGTHGAALELLRELLDDAREYGRRRQDFEQNRMRKAVASRLDLEALQPVLAGKVPLLVSADRVSDLRAAIALGKTFGARIIFVGAAEGWLMAQELAAAQTPVVIQPASDLPSNFDALASRLDNAALLAAAGVKVLFAPFERSHQARTLPQEAGIAVSFGLPWQEAIKAVTSNVADAFGLDAGRLSDGARGDVVLWSGDPLELSSRPVAMWIAGKQVPLTTRQTALLEKYRTLPK
jgi:imidazolonepropionase-like amidohydrolase